VYGNAVPGVGVTFAAPTSGASAVVPGPSVGTGPDGRASITPTAGAVAGSFTVTATAGALSAGFALSNTPGAAAALSAASGSGQTATVGTAFAPLVARVTDRYGNAVGGVAVSFAAPTSGASAVVPGASVSTGSDGRAAITATAGTVAGS